MTIRTLLSKHITENEPFPGASTLDEWRNQKWVKLQVGRRLIPVFPVGPIRDSLHKHDVHHVMTNYSTGWKGEFELAAWELASGGCHFNLLFWADRIHFLLLGLILYPKAIWKALRSGWGSKNLYSMDFSEILDMELADLHRLLRLKS
jgi:hypothetical protein